MKVKEVGNPKPLTASGPICGQGGNVLGFLCTTSGSLEITSGQEAGGDTIVAEMSVTEGAWYPLPFYFADGAYAVLTTAAGTFAV